VWQLPLPQPQKRQRRTDKIPCNPERIIYNKQHLNKHKTNIQTKSRANARFYFSTICKIENIEK
jgi:hypothetical protein